MNNRMLACTIVNNKYLVSTVALMFGDKVYETMVFHCDVNGRVTDWMELDCEQYNAANTAMDGHQAMVTRWTTR